MATIAILSRAVLAIVFFVSSIGKFLDLKSTREGIRQFGVADSIARPLAILLPITEFASAVLLLPASTASVGALLGGLLLVAFSVGIALNLLRGKTPDCHCFGQFHSAPITWRMLIRNLVLIALAAVIIAQGGGPSFSSWWTQLSNVARISVTLGAVIAVVTAAGGWVIWQLFVRYGQLLNRLDRLEASPSHFGDGIVRRPAPPFELGGLYGETISLASMLAKRKPVVLLFSDPNCGPCNSLVPEVVRWQNEYQSLFHLAVISRSGVAANLDKFDSLGVTDVLVQLDNEVAEAYGVNGTPGVVVITADGFLDGPAASGADNIRSRILALAGVPSVRVDVGQHSHDPEPSPYVAGGALSVGDPAPEFELRARGGMNLSSNDLMGREIVYLFWNPQCGFCRELEPELLDWERSSDDHSRELVIISAGLTHEISDLQFSSSVLFDEPFEIAPRFGANGTPMAVVVDRDGTIASDLAVGGPAVMELLAAPVA